MSKLIDNAFKDTITHLVKISEDGWGDKLYSDPVEVTGVAVTQDDKQDSLSSLERKHRTGVKVYSPTDLFIQTGDLITLDGYSDTYRVMSTSRVNFAKIGFPTPLKGYYVYEALGAGVDYADTSQD